MAKNAEDYLDKLLNLAMNKKSNEDIEEIEDIEESEDIEANEVSDNVIDESTEVMSEEVSLPDNEDTDMDILGQILKGEIPSDWIFEDNFQDEGLYDESIDESENLDNEELIYEDTEEYDDFIVEQPYSNEQPEQTFNNDRFFSGSIDSNAFGEPDYFEEEQNLEVYNGIEDFTDSMDDEDALINAYINKVLASDEDVYAKPLEEQQEYAKPSDEVLEYAKLLEEMQEYTAPTNEILEYPMEEQVADHYIDMSQSIVENNELLDALGDMFQEFDKVMVDIPDSTVEEPQDISELQIDDELKEILGDIPDEVSQQDITEEELDKLEEITSDFYNKTDSLPEEIEELNSEAIDEIPDINGENAESLSDSMDDLMAMYNEAISASGDVSGLEDIEEIMSQSAVDDSLLADIPEKTPNTDKATKNKKKSLIELLKSIFADDEEEKTDTDNENQQVIDELFDKDGNLVEEKTKKKKGINLFKKKKQDEDTNPEDIDDLSNNSKKNKKTKDNKKKEKKAKNKVKTVKDNKQPVERVKSNPFLNAVLLMLAIVVIGFAYIYTNYSVYNQVMNQATYLMVGKNYSKAYEEIAGLEPKNDEDRKLYEQIKLVMQINHWYDAYNNYIAMNMQYEALDALITGIAKFDMYYGKATEIGVSSDYQIVKSKILAELNKYGLTEDMARTCCNVTDRQQYEYIINSYKGAVENDSNN